VIREDVRKVGGTHRVEFTSYDFGLMTPLMRSRVSRAGSSNQQKKKNRKKEKKPEKARPDVGRDCRAGQSWT
jgi:hypothetical protein